MTQTHCIFRVLSPGVLVCDHCGRQHKTTTPIERIKPRRCRDFVRGLPPPAEKIEGVGTEAHKIFEALGQKPKSGCNCGAHTKQMNDWGVDGCRANKEIIFGWWGDSYQHATWRERITAAGIAAKHGWAWALTWGGILEEAIRRFEGRKLPVETVAARQRVDQGYRVLLRFAHGLGDNVMFTSVLRHLRSQRPDLIVDCEVSEFNLELIAPWCRQVFPRGQAGSEYDLIHELPMHDPTQAFSDGRSFKAGKAVHETFGLKPDPELLRYSIQPTEEECAAVDESIGSMGPFALIHAAGASSPQKKNLDEVATAELCQSLRNAGVTPIILDWERESPVFMSGLALQWGAGHKLWGRLPMAPPLRLAALAQRSALCVGIDSGPGHIFQASGAKTLIVWTGHHPVHYAPPRMDNVLHLIPRNHERNIYGDAAVARDWLASEYRTSVYSDLDLDLPTVALKLLESG